MTDKSDGLGARLEQMLSANLDRGALLREMERLSQEPAFGTFASLWAPALYERDASFFEAFLLKRLESRHANTIRILLPLAEAAGQDTLFMGLYRKVADQDTWNGELLALARSTQPEEQVLRAVQRREMSQRWFTLYEDVALALYRRQPERLAAFIRQHVRRGWGYGHESYRHLRAEVKQQGDEELSWALFRELAEPGEWEHSVAELLFDKVPAEAVVAELRKRHSTHLWEANTGILGIFVERYGHVVLPYIEENLNWIARRSGERMLDAAEKLGDEDLYWRIFFKAGDPAKWNKALREVLERPLSDAALLLEVQRRMPPAQRWSWWRMEKDVALRFYRRNAEMFRPYLERFLYEPDESLFGEAERVGDEEMLDFLSFWGLRQVAGLIWRAYPSPSLQRWWKPDEKLQKQVEHLGKLLTDRFDRLCAESPATYVQHAANILSRFEAFEVWSFGRNLDHNPAFAYLYRQHRDAWLQSSDGIRELLESTNIYVQIFGLDILGEGGVDAAERVVENLVLLRALLLGRARRSTKRLALRCLEQAARQSAAAAARVLPLLEEALHFQGKRAIDERLMVTFVRLRHAQSAQPLA
ncbi:MAG TPA: hypothetical protein VKT82_04830 [Ktedonobacterales bacterium]|nr:hypothetical protein [Ktedonobacterales bacterium]